MVEVSPEHQVPVPHPNSLAQSERTVHFDFEAPSGYFLPSLDATDPSSFDPTTSNFGLISKAYDSDASPNHHDGKAETDWQRLDRHLQHLNENSPSNTSYTVLFLSRHGQGYHNLAESFYGSAAWDCYYSVLDGDPEPDSGIIWADAHLSKLGQAQARAQSQFWEKQLQVEKMPAPGLWFSSPMARACRTAENTFTPLQEQGIVSGFAPVVKELLRETNGVHTCDRRSPRSVIAKSFPKYKIEHGFTEEDELWDAIYRETDEAHTYRASLLLSDIFSNIDVNEHGRYLSLTAHGGMIQAILRAVQHRPFQVRVGSAIAVVVKAEVQPGKRPGAHFQHGKTKPHCVDDPLKARLPGYKSLKDYVEHVEASVAILQPADD